MALGYSSFMKLDKKDQRKTIKHSYLNSKGEEVNITISGSDENGLASLEEGWPIFTELLRRHTLFYKNGEKTLQIPVTDLNTFIKQVYPKYEGKKINKKIQDRVLLTLDKLSGTKYHLDSPTLKRMFGFVSGYKLKKPKEYKKLKQKDPNWEGSITFDPTFIEEFDKKLIKQIDNQLIRKLGAKAGELYISLMFQFFNKEFIKIPIKKLYEVYINGDAGLELKHIKYKLKSILKELVDNNFIEDPVYQGEDVIIYLKSKHPVAEGYTQKIEVENLIKEEEKRNIIPNPAISITYKNAESKLIKMKKTNNIDSKEIFKILEETFNISSVKDREYLYTN